MNASRRKLQRKYNKLIGLLDQGRKTSFVRLGAIMIPHSFLIVGRLRIRYAAQPGQQISQFTVRDFIRLH